MYRVPSRRKTKKDISKPNLIPILDAVFIFIFFLLMSASFIKIYEIPSDIPIVSDSPPPKTQEKPLALTLKITTSSIDIYTGVPSRFVRKIGKNADGQFDLEGLHSYLLNLKKRHVQENTVILEPIVDISYEELINIMDSIRIVRKTDPAIFIKDKDGLDQRVNTLFDKIVFGNIQS